MNGVCCLEKNIPHNMVTRCKSVEFPKEKGTGNAPSLLSFLGSRRSLEL